MTLLGLPTELLQQIHVLARNPNLAIVNRQLHYSLTSLPPRLVARYLFDLYRAYGQHEILVRSVRHAACTVQVMNEIELLWARERVAGDTPLTTRHPIHPLIEHLFANYAPSANSHKGYPLCRAVLTSNHALVAFLLSHRADPALKDGIAVQIAIQAQDLQSVRLLVERNDERSSEPGRRVRRRMSDRMVITPNLVECALSKGSKDIVEYFVKEKGVLPRLNAIMRLKSRRK